MRVCLLLITLFIAHNTIAQIMTTYGGGGGGFGEGAPATNATLTNPNGGVFDKYGNFYFASNLSGNRIRKIAPSGIITTVAGIGSGGFSGDGLAATLAQLKQPTAVALDSSGNIYVADAANHVIRKINIVTGIISTIAGNTLGGYSGDGGFATSASINNPSDICFDNHGNLYIADYGNSRVRKVSTTGLITTIAGTGIIGYSGDGCKADTCKIGGIYGLCYNNGDLYLSDAYNSRVFKVNSSGLINTVAGTKDGYLYNGDGIQATAANIHPTRITTDKLGNLYIAEHLNYRIRRVDADGIIHTVAGSGFAGHSGDGGPATAASFNYAAGICLDSCGNLYIAEANCCIRKVSFPYCNFLKTDIVQFASKELLYPNPVQNQLIINSHAKLRSVDIVNMLGQRMISQTTDASEVVINTEALPPGVYMAQLSDEEGRKTIKRFIKK